MEDRKSEMKRLVWLGMISTMAKTLLIPSYHSTDLEVHRHWMSLTHSLPFTQWYSDTTSPWTLDYPPFFAIFEYFLSFFAHLLDPTITHLHLGLHYDAPTCLLFQRFTVIVSDLLFFYAVWTTISTRIQLKSRFLTWVLLFSSPGLLMVDHVHFQYNGFLLGILFLSLAALESGRRDLFGGFVFAVLLCFKHLFAVAAPVYFVYLFSHYCRGGGLVKGFVRLVLMGAVVLGVFAVAFGPFWYHGQIHQVLSRMFPFGRGLCHAYWAPNFWVFYIIADKFLALVLAKLGFSIQVPAASFTGGLVGDSSPFAILPTITPLITLIMVLLAMTPCLIKAWRDPEPKMITRWVAYAYTCGFMFGWHVHEKASLHFVIPLAIVAVQSREDAMHYFMLSIVSCYSLFPLLYEAQEYPIKVTLLLLHSALMWFGFSSLFPKTKTATSSENGKRKVDKSKPKGGSGSTSTDGSFVIGWIEKSYLLGLLAVEVWGQFLQPLVLGKRFPFLPLMMVSMYCAMGMMYSWIWQLRQIVRA